MSPKPRINARALRTIGWPAALCIVLFWPVHAWAIWEKFSPFGPGQPPTRFPQTHLVARRIPAGADMAAVEIAFHQTTSGALILRLNWTDGDGYRLALPGTGSTAPFSMAIEGSPLCDNEASTTDLNRDGVTDFIVVTHSGGNGLAAQITFVTFVLSSPTGYVGRSVLSFDAQSGDLFDLDSDGRPEFVHGMMVWGETGKDGKAHNYWVYNLLRFSGTEIVSANFGDLRFPKWIMFSHAANHAETQQLTADQREQQWIRTWEFQAKGARALPTVPALLALAKEQRRERAATP
jgi:hypothetical protein